MSAILDTINQTADDPSVAVYLPIPLAERLIQMVGGERVIDEPGAAPAPIGTWVFPDGFWTWATDEAVRYALEAAPDVCES